MGMDAQGNRKTVQVDLEASGMDAFHYFLSHNNLLKKKYERRT